MLTGSIVALVTPFKNNEIDYTALENLINFHLENGTDGILLCGTTGESPTLAGDEKERMVNFCKHKIVNRIPLIVGTGTNNPGHTISATMKAKNWGADYALVITPYYNKPNQEGLYHFFRKIVETCDIPIIIYNVPGRTGINISAETTIRLANEFEQIVGIKEAGGNLVQASQIIKYTDPDFFLLSGEDALNLPLMSCGAKGAISVTANIIPRKVHDLIDLCLQGDFSGALRLHQEILELNRVLFIDTNPIPVKTALAMMEMIEKELRLPLYSMCSEKETELKRILQENRLIGN